MKDCDIETDVKILTAMLPWLERIKSWGAVEIAATFATAYNGKEPHPRCLDPFRTACGLWDFKDVYLAMSMVGKDRVLADIRSYIPLAEMWKRAV